MKFWKEKHKITASPGQPYSKYTIDYVKKYFKVDLTKAPWYGKVIALEAAPTAGTLTALSGIPGIVSRIDKHPREGNRVFLVPTLKPYTGWTIVFAHLGKVLIKNGWKTRYDTEIGLISPTHRFTGAGTGNHIAIYGSKKVNNKTVNPDVRPIEKLQPPKPVAPVKPTAKIEPAKPADTTNAAKSPTGAILTQILLELIKRIKINPLELLEALRSFKWTDKMTETLKRSLLRGIRTGIALLASMVVSDLANDPAWLGLAPILMMADKMIRETFLEKK